LESQNKNFDIYFKKTLENEAESGRSQARIQAFFEEFMTKNENVPLREEGQHQRVKSQQCLNSISKKRKSFLQRVAPQANQAKEYFLSQVSDAKRGASTDRSKAKPHSRQARRGKGSPISSKSREHSYSIRRPSI